VDKSQKKESASNKRRRIIIHNALANRFNFYDSAKANTYFNYPLAEASGNL
jgi:hypothetical protein